jgi:hypothetical protein
MGIKIKFIILRMKNNEKEKKDAKEITLKTFPDRPPEKTSEEKGQEFQKTKEDSTGFLDSESRFFLSI